MFVSVSVSWILPLFRMIDWKFSDGRSRAGVYCAANACIEQVIQHGEVDVFQAVKTVRRHRPQLIENMVKLFTFKQFAFKMKMF